jgi:hypothetical protein
MVQVDLHKPQQAGQELVPAGLRMIYDMREPVSNQLADE